MKKYLILLVLSCIFLLSGCTRNDEIAANLTYEKFEGVVEENGNSSTYEYTEYEGVTYYFQIEEYNEPQRKRIIADVHEVLQVIMGADENILPDNFSIYFGSGLHQKGVYGNAFYDDAYEMNTADILTLLQSVYGEYANYGLMYGYADFVMRQIGLEGQSICSQEEMVEYFAAQDDSTISEILDLNLPLFEGVYADEEVISISESIAVSFVDYIIAGYGQGEMDALLAMSYSFETSFDEAFCKKINEWIEKELEMEYHKIPYNYAIRFEKNFASDNENYPYVLHTVSTENYINRDMQAVWYESEAAEWELFDYHKMMQYFNFLEEDIAAAREYLSAWFDLETDRLEMRFFMPGEENWYGGIYEENKRTASIIEVQSAFHEYIHYLTSKYSSKVSMMEGLAVYMDIYQPENRSSRVRETTWWLYHADQYERIPEGKEEDIEFLKAVSAYSSLAGFGETEIEAKYDLESYYERVAYMECLGSEGWSNNVGENPSLMGMSYEKAGSMFNYIINTYGEETAFAVYKDYGALEEKLGVSYEELLRNWEADLILRAEKTE